MPVNTNFAQHGTARFRELWTYIENICSTRKCRYEIVVLHAIWFRNTTPPYQCIFSDSTWKSRSILKVALSFFVGFCMPTSYWPRIKVTLLIKTRKLIMTFILIILIQSIFYSYDEKIIYILKHYNNAYLIFMVISTKNFSINYNHHFMNKLEKIRLIMSIQQNCRYTKNNLKYKFKHLWTVN